MSNPKKRPNILEIRLIRRRQVRQGLVFASVLALLISSCSKKSNLSNTTPNLVTNKEEKVEAVFYENVAQCEANTTKLQAEYQQKLTAYQNKQLSQYPVAPQIKPEDCEAKISAARQQHDKNAPSYSSLVECEAQGVSCENTSSGYRPRYGGSYFYPYGSTRRYTNDSGRDNNRRAYETPKPDRNSYADDYYNPDSNTTTTSPNSTRSNSTTGTTITSPNSTRSNSNSTNTTTTTTPKRPSSKSGRGAIKGRSSRGFGSTYRSTGKGGK